MGEGGVGGVGEGGDFFSLMMVADAAFEDDKGSRRGRLGMGDEGGGVDGLIGDGEHVRSDLL